MRVLNVGGGPRSIPLPGHYRGWDVVWLDVDPEYKPDIVLDAVQLATLPAAHHVYDAVYASHLIEHLYPHQVAQFLAGVRHVLKEDGYLELRVPDAGAAVKIAAQSGFNTPLYNSAAGPINARDMLWGYAPYVEASGDAQAHHDGFTESTLRRALERAGFAHIYTRAHGYEIAAIATMAAPVPAFPFIPASAGINGNAGADTALTAVLDRLKMRDRESAIDPRGPPAYARGDAGFSLGWTNIALCIPTNGPPTWALLDSVAQFQAYHYRTQQGVTLDVVRPPRALPVDLARNYLARVVLEGEYDYLWFVDQDCAFHPQTLERLRAWDVPVVGALALIRGSTQCWPMAFRGLGPRDTHQIAINEAHEFMRLHYDVMSNDPQIVEPAPPGSLFQVDFTGCHCLLIKRSVLQSLEPPWFAGQPGQEDRHFCLAAQKAGIPVYVDFSTFAAHATGDRLLGAWDFMAHYRLFAEVQAVEAMNERNENQD